MTSPEHRRVAVPAYPQAPREPIVEDYHGHPVADPYRWLEGGHTEAVRDWIGDQQLLSTGYLERLPGLGHWGEAIRGLMSGPVRSPVKIAGSRRFRLGRRDSLAAWEPEFQSRDGGPWTPIDVTFPPDAFIRRWQPSPTGEHLSIQIVLAGDERHTPLSIVEVTTGRIVDAIAHTRYSPIEWRADGRGFFYVRDHLDRPGRGVYWHMVGTPVTEDEILIGDEGATTRYHVGLCHDRWLVFTIREGTSRETQVLVADIETGGRPRPLSLDGASSASVLVDEDGRLLATVSTTAGFGQVLVAEPVSRGWGPWRVLIPEDTAAALSTVALARTGRGKRLVALRTRDGLSQMTVHDAETGAVVTDVVLPGTGAVMGIMPGPDPGALTLSYTDWVIPPSVWRLDVESGRVTPVDSEGTPRADIRILHRTYRSFDGTEVPLTILAPAADGDGDPGRPRPAILTAYGGFGISFRPKYEPDFVAWVLRGGVSAVAGIRGGDERGRQWHRDGARTNKPNAFADLHAAADWLVRQGWTTPEQLALLGGSNGGLLAMGTVVQRPHAYAAVVSAAAPLDMIRYERWGLGRAWRQEYGSPEDPADLEALLKYSPYHNVRAPFGNAAVLLLSGDNDTRVDPLHSRKMAAQLQHAADGGPILHHMVEGAGHAGAMGDEAVRLAAKVLTFLAHHTGLTGSREGGAS
ncbi:prolyl oligopeptidase family serine peptidase [Planotetraspora sp. A-T 1434]|uniref:prolyl oligopeptidase family serine peptidase n=1 Tax=Planotetraspora sp. A-T 1434 TaxID=2979219 RepID=UPI0021C19C9D|nr:prolyl oligopeptidase family serine peptidase [Planotetraspora sp. A-T 1434]MCT9933599.1 prolyl oligopeptidase family serine peptidase [Planotetraspora sp. A-T 1434]